MKLSVATNMCSLTGYSELGRNIVLGLDKLGTDISLKILDENMLQSSESMLPADILDLIRRCKTKKLPEKIPVLTIGAPPQYDVRMNIFKIAVGMFEAFSLPPAWLQLMNTMNLILTPSTFNQQVFIRQGLSKDKIAVIPPAVDAERFKDAEPFYIDAVRPFTILFLSQLILRKGWDKLLKAVLRTFRINDDVTLILKLPPPNSEAQAIGMIERLKAVKQEAGPSKVHVYYNHYPIPIEQVPKVYAALKKKLPGKIYSHLNGSEPRGVFCLPSLGEGIGLGYLEAMASGVLTIGTNVTGSSFLNPNNSIVIKTGPPVRNLQLELESTLYRNSPFPQVDIIAISKALSRAYNMKDEERNKITGNALEDVKGYTYEKCCVQILTEIQARI